MKSLSSRLAIGLIGLVCLAASAAAADPAYPGTKTQWNGFDRYDFTFGERGAILVVPKTPAVDADGKHPWIWRALFFGHEPQADIALLEKGFFLAYSDVSTLFGAPTAVKHWDAFHAEVTAKYNLAPKVALEGLSRGGLIIYNFAAAHPDKVSCLYGDAPVCDFKSWPLGKGTGKGSPKDWQVCLAAYGFTEEQALAFKGNPIDNLAPIAKAKIPILHVVGDADDVVPVAENTAIVEARYKELGGEIQVIHKPGVGHHPHSLVDPAPIVEFVVKHARLK